jgi:uncharacterized damage-inducible protein DinB
MMADAARYFVAMAQNNAWANLRLLNACCALTADEFAAERTSFFPSLQATLNHILIVDWFYVDALEGGSLGPRAWENQIPHPYSADLKMAQAAVDQRLIDFCQTLDKGKLAAECHMHRQAHVQIDRVDRTLLHLFEHQIHHRGQAHAMLAGTGVKPPQLDEFFMAGDARFRTAEFEELGWEEAAVWRGLTLP